MFRFSFLSAFLAGFVLLLAAVALWPQIDLAVSNLFASSSGGFFLKNSAFLLFFERAAFWSSRLLAILFSLCGAAAVARKEKTFGLSRRAWLFLLFALLIGPGLTANVGFKDHWGRARPRETVQFGGVKEFTPALRPADQCLRNCSFVSGDGAFGFFLPCFAYVVSRRRSRRVFWAGMAAGAVFGGARIMLGAHFLSDVLYAAALSLVIGAALAVPFFGAGEVADRWKFWFRPPFSCVPQSPRP